MSDLLATVKARVAEDKARHEQDRSFGGCVSACAGDWPCDAARYLSFAEARLAWIEGALEPNPPREYKWQSEYDNCRQEDAESELFALAKLLVVQG